jgi:hypothetical protein
MTLKLTAEPAGLTKAEGAICPSEFSSRSFDLNFCLQFLVVLSTDCIPLLSWS